MSALLDRFSVDLDKLIKIGDQLFNSMQRDIVGTDVYKKEVVKQIGEEKAEEFLKALPRFKVEYEAWYSQSIALLKQVLPDRLSDFISMYEKPKSRKSIEYGNYTIQDFMMNLVVKNSFGEQKVGPAAAFPQYEQQLAIVKAARTRFSSSLFDIKQIIQADLFDSEIVSARGLLKAGFVRAAGVICGVLIEKHLSEVASSRNLRSSKRAPSISDLNELLRAAEVISVPQWRHITLMGDYRNTCSHAKGSEPTIEQVNDLISGADKIIRTIS